jgi:hypothetical protein
LQTVLYGNACHDDAPWVGPFLVRLRFGDHFVAIGLDKPGNMAKFAPNRI